MSEEHDDHFGTMWGDCKDDGYPAPSSYESDERKMENVKKFLFSYGSAIRGDHKHLDGRSVQSSLHDICDFISKGGMTDEELERKVEKSRICLGCDSWLRWCDCEDEDNG